MLCARVCDVRVLLLLVVRMCVHMCVCVVSVCFCVFLCVIDRVSLQNAEGMMTFLNGLSGGKAVQVCVLTLQLLLFFVCWLP